MRGRKPNIDNVIPMRGDADAAGPDHQAVMRRAVNLMRPRGLSKELRREWDRVAFILADPAVDRLKPRFADTILEYCRAVRRLHDLRKYFEDMAKQLADATGKPADAIAVEIYRVKSRNGDQAKCHPHVAQINEAWRNWARLVAMLGLSPADERNMIPGQGDLFDESDRYLA